jgi:DNA-binding PadR family transcriptional regulator
MAASTTRMLALGMLRDRPMHGYEITQVITQGALDRWAPVLPGSIYHALAKMEAEGLVRTHAEERTGDRLRKIYAITPAGTAELTNLVRHALTEPPHDLRSDLALATLWMTLLAPEQARGALREARAKLEEARRQRRIGRAHKGEISPIAQALFDNADAVADADLHLLERLEQLTNLP